jgi:hypothetical protein
MTAVESRRPGPAMTWSSPRRVFLATLVGVLLLELAWILTLPAFGGMDEFDHSFRAESVAHGHVRGGAPTAHGRGGQVVVPEDLAAAASRMCGSYDYTGHDNCHPVKRLSGGMVVIDSGASSYNPVYYAVVGTLARPFHGANMDFAARVVTALVAAALLAWAALVTRARSRSTWPFLALVVVTTPTLVYSAAVTSPNGVGYAAGALVWSAALCFVASDRPPPVTAFAVGSVVLLVSHSTGFIWLAVTALAVVILRPRSEWIVWVRRNSLRVLAAGSMVLVAALGCLGWILTQKTNFVAIDDSVVRHTFPSVAGMLGQWAVWCLQTIGAFPIRDQPAPLIVYPMWLVPFVLLMLLGWRAAGTRVRAAMVLVTLAWLLIPTGATVKTYAALGYAWQGRYALPLSVGLPILAGLALAGRRREPSRTTVLGVLALCALAQAICVVNVAARGTRSEFAPSVVAGTPGAVVAGLLALAGGAVISLALTRSRMAVDPVEAEVDASPVVMGTAAH